MKEIIIDGVKYTSIVQQENSPQIGVNEYVLMPFAFIVVVTITFVGLALLAKYIIAPILMKIID